jgi:hypothetical protein
MKNLITRLILAPVVLLIVLGAFVKALTDVVLDKAYVRDNRSCSCSSCGSSCSYEKDKGI